MHLYGGLLLLGAWGISADKVIVSKAGFNVPIKMNKDWKQLVRNAGRAGIDASELSGLRLDLLNSVDELAMFPKEFFAKHLTLEHLRQIAENPALCNLLTGEALEVKSEKAKLRLSNRRELIRAHLHKLNPDNFSGFDQLLARTSRSLYKYYDPLPVLASKHFKASLKGYMNVFGITEKQMKKKKYQQLASAIKEMAKQPVETLLTTVVGIAFQLMVHGVPMPSFITNRIARITTQITAKRNAIILDDARRQARQAKSSAAVATKLSVPKVRLDLKKVRNAFVGLRRHAGKLVNSLKRKGEIANRIVLLMLSIQIVINELEAVFATISERIAAIPVLGQLYSTIVTKLYAIHSMITSIHHTASEKPEMTDIDMAFVQTMASALAATMETLQTHLEDLAQFHQPSTEEKTLLSAKGRDQSLGGEKLLRRHRRHKKEPINPDVEIEYDVNNTHDNGQRKPPGSWLPRNIISSLLHRLRTRSDRGESDE